MYLKAMLILRQAIAALALLLGGSAANAQTFGNAVSLNGTEFVRTTYNDDLDFEQFLDTRNFTIEFWFNADRPGVLLGEVDSADVTKWDYALAEILPGGVIKAAVPDVPIITVGAVQFGSWNHLAIAYNNATRRFSAFLNGMLAGTSIGNRRTLRDAERVPVYAFGRAGPTNLGGGGFFSGKFDEVRIWRLALPESTIVANWNRLVPCDEQMATVWHFDFSDGYSSPNSCIRMPGMENRALHVPFDQPMRLVPSEVTINPMVAGIVTGSAVVGDSVQVNGAVNPRGTATSVYFQWGATTNYGNGTPLVDAGNGTTNVSFSQTLTNVQRGVYHFRAAAVYGNTTVYGVDSVFMVPMPTLETETAEINDRTAQLRATANPQGIPANVFFQWGVSTAYGNITPLQPAGAGSIEVTASETLTNLPAGLYFYRAVLTNAIIGIQGRNRYFTIGNLAGSAVLLSGANYLRTTKGTHQWQSSDFTFEFWFNASTPGILIGEVDAVDVTKWDYALAEVLPTGVIKVGLPNVGTIAAGTVSLNEWNHLAITYSDGSEILSAYLNGLPAGAAIGKRRRPFDDGRAAVYTFGRGGPTNLGGGRWFSGQIDEVRIWQTARDSAEIATHWNVPLAGDAPGLKALWHLNTATHYSSPDGRIAADDPAWHVPEITVPLVPSTAPLAGFGPQPDAQSATVIRNGALLHGSWAAAGETIKAYFEWGETAAYGNTTITNDFATGSGEVNFSAAITNLANGVYHFRAVVLQNGLKLQGEDSAFSVAEAPSVKTLAPVLNGPSANLVAAVNPYSVPTQVFFEWGRTKSYGNSTVSYDVGTGVSEVRVNHPLTQLDGGTYHYRAVALFDGRRANGPDVTFTIVPYAGRAVSLSGTNFVRTWKTSTKLFDTKSLSFELWFNASGPCILIGEVDTISTAFWDNAIAEVLPNGNLVVGLLQPPYFHVPAINAGPVSFGSWNHLAVVYNHTNQTLSAYYNGALKGSSTGWRDRPQDLRRDAIYSFGRGGPVYLGGGSWFTGYIDEIRIWKTALQEDQIATYWKQVLTTDPPGLVALWHFDSAIENLSLDSRGAADNPAYHVPPEKVVPLVWSSAPIGPFPPLITGNAEITGNSAKLWGSLSPQGAATQVYFEWGRTTNYGNTTAIQDFAGGKGIEFSEQIMNLSGGVHHYRALGTSEGRFLFR